VGVEDEVIAKVDGGDLWGQSPQSNILRPK